jgi:hypothetical protein
MRIRALSLGLSGVFLAGAAAAAEPFYSEDQNKEEPKVAGAPEETEASSSAAPAAPAADTSVQRGDPETTPPKVSLPERHDGFYARAGVGFGALTDRMTIGIPIIADVDGSATGPSVGLHVAGGLTVAKGFVIGGFFATETVTNPKVQVEGERVDADVSVGTFALVGPLVDWYPNPVDGWHLGAGIGPCSISVEDDAGNIESEQPVGFGGTLFGGYDLWIGEEWSIGGLARAVGGTLTGDAVVHRLGAFSLALVATYH